MSSRGVTAKDVVVDKASITVGVVARLIAEQFSHWADLPLVPVALDGWDNTSFRLGACQAF